MRIVYALGIIPALASVLFFSSCGQLGKSDKAKVSDEKRFILVPDVDSILPEWSKENVVVNHWVVDPDNLHPALGKNSSRSWVLSLTSNYILRSDNIHLTVVPDLAAAMPEETPDHLRFTYTLRKDARWNDGTPITAEDALFLFKAHKCPLTNNPSAKPYFENVSDVILYPDDRYKFTIVMKKTYFQNISFLTDFPVMERTFFDPGNVLAGFTFQQFDDSTFHADMHPELVAWAKEFNDPKYGNDPAFFNGSGPYKVTEWTRGQTLTLERKNDHWTKKITDPRYFEAALPEKIIFKINTDPNSEILEFKAQTMDASVWVPSASALELMKDPGFMKNYNINFTDNYAYNYIGFNMRPDGTAHKKIFDDVQVRKACAYIVPVDEIMQVIAAGYGKRQSGPVSPLKQEYNKDLPLIPYDLERGKQLLDSAGWKDTDGDNIRDKIINGEKVPFSVTLKYGGGQAFVEDMAKMLKDAFYKAGIEINLNGLDGAALGQSLSNHDFDMYMSAWSGGSLPEDFTQIWHSGSYANGGSNYVGFGNAATDALIDSIKYTMDMDKRIPLVKELQKEIYDAQPYIFLYSTSRKNIIHKRFGNQYMTLDRPGNVLGYLKLLSLYGIQNGTTVKEN